VDHISDINLPYTEHARRYLLQEGIDGKTIFVTGSPMKEVLLSYRDKIESSDVLNRLKLEKSAYILLSAHREENIDHEKNLQSLLESVNDIARNYQMPIIYSMHPRSKKFIEQKRFEFHPLVKPMKPFGFLDYNKLQLNSYCVLSDSGTLSEESALLGFPGILIRTSTERPEVLDKGCIVIGGIAKDSIRQAIDLSVSMFQDQKQRMLPIDYEDSNVSMKIVKLIQSYTEIVNITTWMKNK
jgi:UDP-N-acetylglucosamine 2-epimerase (non-hydrolysing)